MPANHRASPCSQERGLRGSETCQRLRAPLPPRPHPWELGHPSGFSPGGRGAMGWNPPLQCTTLSSWPFAHALMGAAGGGCRSRSENQLPLTKAGTAENCNSIQRRSSCHYLEKTGITAFEGTKDALAMIPLITDMRAHMCTFLPLRQAGEGLVFPLEFKNH